MNSVRQQDGDLLFQQRPGMPLSVTDSSTDGVVSPTNDFFQTALSYGSTSSPSTGFGGLRRQRQQRQFLSVIAEDEDMILYKAHLKKQTASQCLADLADSVVNTNATTSQDPCRMETEELPPSSSCLFPSEPPVEAADDDWGYFYADSSPEIGTSGGLHSSKNLGQRSRRRHPKYPRAGGRCSPNSTMLLPPKQPQGNSLCQP